MDPSPILSPILGKITRSYTRRPLLDPNPTIPAPPAASSLYRADQSTWTPPPATQPRLRARAQTVEDKLAAKFAAMDEFLLNSPFDSVGDFLAILFFNRPHGESDPRGSTHAAAVACFLRGRTKIRMSDVLPLMYQHRCSYPSKDSIHLHERELMFCTTGDASTIHHARPFISTWATRLVAAEARKQIGRTTTDDSDDPDFRVQLRACTNGRGKAAAHVVTWRDFRNFGIKTLAERFLVKLALPMFLTKYMSAPMKRGVFIERKQRPYPMVQVAALSSFIVSRNRYATGYMAMLLGIWHFVCKSHVDVKRVYCRFGNAVADSTARDALRSMTAADIKEMQADTLDANDRGETEHCLLLDNVQEYDRVYEPGLGRQSRLKVGTAGTKVKLQGCAPGAFSATDYYTRVARNERKTMTVRSLIDDIDWDHDKICSLFRSTPIAKRRMPADHSPTQCQPLMVNSERETESQGMLRAVEDFDRQIGVDVERNPNLLSWIRGDGASYAQILRLSRYTAPIGNFRNKIATPEVWHTGATDLNSIAENHYGPATSSDPSSLSKASTCAGLKRPSNLKSCDYYPTVRSLTLIWTAHVLDCWRVFYGTEDLIEYFDGLEKANKLPNLDAILTTATTLVDRYTSQAALQNSLRASDATSIGNPNPVPVGSPWVARGGSGSLVDGSESKLHQEHAGFTGDRVLRNSEIFLLEFGWWNEMAWAVPEGDIGRVWEIFKIWIFKFAGSSHQNYMKYLLEFYCLLRYESSKGLHDAILDNLLLRVKDELIKYKPADLHQEHYNKWLQEMSRRHGGEFDESFFRQIISPNVDHFLRFKKEMETAFNLVRRGKSHTSPHQRPELRLLLSMFKEEEIHLFRQGRSMGHAAVNQFSRGVRQLEEGKLHDFIDSTTCLGDFFAAICGSVREDSPEPDNSPTLSPSNSDNDTDSVRADSPASSLSRADSPTPSSSGSEDSSASQSSSASSKASVASAELDPADPNEPENDGIDMSDEPRFSGSFNDMYIDDEMGLQINNNDEEEEEAGEEENEEEEDCDEEPDPANEDCEENEL
ncbi:hypothetical protein GGX14DRAFT_537504 [Mycena pura]|uniref:DUF6589 domain-containing protein n=1 Tax=Mycena pura TaxID=153505 RepID=A0AAD6USK0_9AGAR|nr:hypothetical protein GGX14DRAFT_537504 [Mycena pura]